MSKKSKPIANINPIPQKLLHFAVLFAPIILTIFALLIVPLGYVDTGKQPPLTWVLVICLAWIGFGTYAFLRPARTNSAVKIRLIGLHILAAIYVLFISGIAMPFTILWMLLFVAAQLYFGISGLYLSVLALFGLSTSDVLLNLGDTAGQIDIIFYFTATVVMGLVVSLVYSGQEVDRRELLRSQKAEKLQRERAITLINNISDAVISTDKSGKIQLYNAATTNLLDTNQELRGKTIDQVIKMRDTLDKPFNILKHLKQARSVVLREDIRSEISEESIRLGLIYAPIRDADTTEPGNNGYIVIMRDITEQKSLEEERDEFISVVSHELRTPITIAEGALSNVNIMMTRNDIPHQRLVSSVLDAHEQVMFLSRLVNDLATLSRAERGVSDSPELIDVNVLINNLYNEYSPQAKSKGLKFDIDIPPKVGFVSVSSLYLKEFLQNFTTNAIKYTKKGGIVVSVVNEDGMIRFAIKDSGIGLSKSDQAKVFKRFWRSEDYRTRETGGTGLGLYVAGKLARKLGTTIEISSRLNYGSTFSFVIPAASPDDNS